MTPTRTEHAYLIVTAQSGNGAGNLGLELTGHSISSIPSSSSVHTSLVGRCTRPRHPSPRALLPYRNSAPSLLHKTAQQPDAVILIDQVSLDVRVYPDAPYKRTPINRLCLQQSSVKPIMFFSTSSIIAVLTAVLSVSAAPSNVEARDGSIVLVRFLRFFLGLLETDRNSRLLIPIP